MNPTMRQRVVERSANRDCNFWTSKSELDECIAERRSHTARQNTHESPRLVLAFIDSWSWLSDMAVASKRVISTIFDCRLAKFVVHAQIVAK